MSLGKGAGGPPPALSYADERGLLEELEQAAAGQMDFRGGGARGERERRWRQHSRVQQWRAAVRRTVERAGDALRGKRR